MSVHWWLLISFRLVYIHNLQSCVWIIISVHGLGDALHSDPDKLHHLDHLLCPHPSHHHLYGRRKIQINLQQFFIIDYLGIYNIWTPNWHFCAFFKYFFFRCFLIFGMTTICVWNSENRHFHVLMYKTVIWQLSSIAEN